MNRSISVGIRPTPLSEIGYVDRYTQPKPRGIQFPDGTVLRFNANWFNVLRMTAHWLAHTGRLTASNARVRHKKIRHLRVTDGENPTHPTARNRPFRSPEPVAEGVYLENNWTAEDAKNGAIGLLERFDIDPDSVIIGF